MQMESHIARGRSRTLPSRKGKRENVQIQNSSLIQPSHNPKEKINPQTVHVDKEGGEFQSAQIRKKDICHTPIPGPTLLADPNRVRGARPYTGTLYPLYQTLVCLSLITKSKYYIQNFKIKLPP